MSDQRIRKRLASFLKKWPAVYYLAGAIYANLRFTRLKELVIGTKAKEQYWSNRHLHKGNDWNNPHHIGETDEWVLGYWESRNHSHRSFLLEKIAGFSPISSILEIGCNCGPNLYLITQKFPGIEIQGIDINPVAIRKGNELFNLEGISNVQLSIGKADELGQFRDKSFDIVFTDAVLIYIGPDKIEKVLKEMLRVSRLVLVLLEQHDSDAGIMGKYRRGKWIRDYVALLKQFVPAGCIHLTKITSDLWSDPDWETKGALIEIALQSEAGDAVSHNPVGSFYK